jgi:hypothetical protein
MYASCGCDRSLTGRPSGDWEWRGCHSNVKFAGGLTKEFSTARVAKTGHAERKKMNRHNIRAGIKVGHLHRMPTLSPGRACRLGMFIFCVEGTNNLFKVPTIIY